MKIAEKETNGRQRLEYYVAQLDKEQRALLRAWVKRDDIAPAVTEDLCAVFDSLLGHTEEELETATQHSLTDPLTGIYNLRYFKVRLNDAIKKINRTPGAAINVVWIDLDNFKQINDVQGHAAGDEVLRRAAGFLQESTRPYDVVARLGGDELAVLMDVGDEKIVNNFPSDADLPRISPGTAKDRIQNGLSEIGIEASVGVLGVDAGTLTKHPDAESILKVADKRMYRDKEARKQALASAAPENAPVIQ